MQLVVVVALEVVSGRDALELMRAIRPDATGDITPSKPGETNAGIAWVHPRQGNYMQTPIVVGNVPTKYCLSKMFSPRTKTSAQERRG